MNSKAYKFKAKIIKNPYIDAAYIIFYYVLGEKQLEKGVNVD